MDLRLLHPQISKSEHLKRRITNIKFNQEKVKELKVQENANRKVVDSVNKTQEKIKPNE